MLDIDRLRALNAIAEYGSVSAAADVLGITTSAVSQQIAKLERETRARLLERNGRGVRLTDAAHVLVGHSERILTQIAEAEADLEAQRGAVAGRIRIAAFATAARGLLPGVLRAVTQDHPGLSVRLHELDPKYSLPQVLRGEFDLAVVHEWENSPLPTPDGLDRAHLLDDPAEIAMGTAHRLAGRASLGFTEIATECWIGAPPGDICHAWLRDTLRRNGVEPTVVHYATEYPTQLALAAMGLGIALLPRLGRGMIPPGVVALPVRPELFRSIYVVWRSEDSRRPVVRAMVEALRAAADSLEETRAAGVSHGVSPPTRRD